MFILVVAIFLVAGLTPWLHRFLPRTAVWWIAAFVAGAFAFCFSLTGSVLQGGSISSTLDWIPALGLSLSFHADGLSLLFAVLILGIGFLVLLYASKYMSGHSRTGGFYAYLMMFMGSMIGLVFAGNLLLLFVFWELTSLSSFLLIGFHHDRAESRAAALQALLVTGVGGLAMLAGFVMLGLIGGTYEISALLTQGDAIKSNALYGPVLILILCGAFTKSAQVPFHFWLPSAMAAPTPVSAYLHSATMVKAGVYLLARLHPVLGHTDLWFSIVPVAGAVTMLTGALLAFVQTDLKKLLAYTTISALGTLMLLLGFGTVWSLKAAMVFLVVHSMYKGALFLVAGAVDHESGTRDLRLLGGLRHFMPVTTAAAVLAALSMAGLPPMLGFISKELLYEAKLHAPSFGLVITVLGVAANMFIVAVAFMFCLKTFFLGKGEFPKEPHEVPRLMLVGPVVLSFLGLSIGLFPDDLADRFIGPAVSAIRGETTEISLGLWQGINPVLLLSILTVAGGLVLYSVRSRFVAAHDRLGLARVQGPSRWYDTLVDGLPVFARRTTGLLQEAPLRGHLLVVLLAGFAFVGTVLVLRTDAARLPVIPSVRLLDVVLAAAMVGGALFLVVTSSRLAAVVALGAVGYGIALVYTVFGAPDLALTQFAIETLSVILFILVMQHLPEFRKLSGNGSRARDVLVAAAGGALVTALLLLTVREPLWSHLAAFFSAKSLVLANGRNVVNVILVDFRALDTLGEITVLGIAALGVYGLLKLRLRDEERT